MQEISLTAARNSIANKFRRNQFITDLNLINLLRTKAEMEFEEAATKYKTRMHIYDAIVTDTQLSTDLTPSSVDRTLRVNLPGGGYAEQVQNPYVLSSIRHYPPSVSSPPSSSPSSSSSSASAPSQAAPQTSFLESFFRNQD